VPWRRRTAAKSVRRPLETWLLLGLPLWRSVGTAGSERVQNMAIGSQRVTVVALRVSPVHHTAISVSAQHAWRESGLDNLRDMCYHIVLGGPERREQVSLVRFAL